MTVNEKCDLIHCYSGFISNCTFQEGNLKSKFDNPEVNFVKNFENNQATTN